ncbi:MAG: ABC transporter ATP-binding protein [Anaerolineae bacterium]|nr:ABC transporter ATP-binding protein [Anaerolineae bacterium]
MLAVKNLHVHYHTPLGPARAVNDVTFTLSERQRLGLVGESGSGKTTTALAIMRLLDWPAKIESGQVLLAGRDLLALNEEEMRAVRFAQISLIPQGAMNSLNPVIRIREQIAELFDAHNQPLAGAAREARIAQLLEQVGLRPQVAGMFPHELSGGMKQRVCIAMAIALRPKVIIADEPTSALDVVVQRQVMGTLGRVQQDLGAAVILVGHDMGLMAQFVDLIGVMYAGRLVEFGPVRSIFKAPKHPYTQYLISSVPTLQAKRQFKSIPGVAPSLINPPPGCPFHPRCTHAMPRCAQILPLPREVGDSQIAACHLYEEEVHAAVD